MKKILIGVVIVLLLTVSIISFVAADEPQGDCPPKWHLHMVSGHSHEGHGQHQHVGNDFDRNEDGYICGKHVGRDGNIHVHTDNNIPN